MAWTWISDFCQSVPGRCLRCLLRWRGHERLTGTDEQPRGDCVRTPSDVPTQEVLLSKGAISVRASSKKRGKAKITVTLAGKKTTLLIQVT